MVTTSIRSALRPLSTSTRAKVMSAFRARGHAFARLNDDLRLALTEAIFAVETDLEHRLHAHPQVALMRAVRNVLLDEITVPMGGNEGHPGLTWSHHDAVRTEMRRKARRGNVNAFAKA